jgi:SulP family sulfate permease
MNEPRTRLGSEPMFRELFKPWLVSARREGCGLSRLRADALSGLTVALVALPLSMTSAAI